ncbi:metallophosphoesterase family protein [Sinorhizobium sp. BG8]|uniref:metallophosphoesterase family protein n=1 Tax=Sinorhizobium sp. BG8 TaxID=2613773 RepID=UPI00193CDD9C|nr:metallophosphoesterase family protein [Sinorhizobium sp. BG8]QRM55578.1 metallophosphoesterase family protein [Sinorhizobium sp. BG8]
MQIAVLADIHGNISALEAVLDDVGRRGVDLIVNLGDCVSGPLWPRETFERLERLGAPTVRGNHDRQVAAFDSTKANASDRFAFQELSEAQRAVLGQFPFSRKFAPGIVGFHATPAYDDRYVLDEIASGVLVRAPMGKIVRRLGDIAEKLVILGHSHRPDLVRLPSGTIVMNPGSVGCPAYFDPTGQAHASESGTPHARYAIVDTVDGGDPSIEFVALAYDYEAAACRAETNDRPDWAHALRTGFMPHAGI